VPWLLMFGTRRVGSGSTAADWRGYYAGGPMGGTALVRNVPLAATFATYMNTLLRIVRQLGADVSTSMFRTPGGTAFEHFAYLEHEIPWDTVNDTPDQAVIQQLVSGTATWADPAILNGGLLKCWYPLVKP
jgi:hypothetical protein